MQNLFKSSFWMGFWLNVSNILLGISILLILFFYIGVDRKVGYYFMISYLSALGTISLLKPLIGELRPFQYDSRIRHVDIRFSSGKSFPSGHCAAVSSCSQNFYTYYRNILSYYMPFFWTVNVLIVFSRVILGSHYFHDCITGFVLGYISSYFILQLQIYYSIFFDKYGYCVSAFLIIAGITCAILAQIGFPFFRDCVTTFHVITSIGCISIGDRLEKKLIGCVCQSRNMKRIFRFVLFLFFAWLIYELYFAVVIKSIIGWHIFCILISFYVTIGFSYLASNMMLFDNSKFGKVS